MIELSSCGRQQGKIKKVLDLYDLNSNIPVFRGNSKHDEIYRFVKSYLPGLFLYSRHCLLNYFPVLK